MEQELKEQVEALYKQLGTSFAEAVRIFARQSIQNQGMPFIMQLSSPEHRRTLGLANGNYVIPDDIDGYQTIPFFSRKNHEDTIRYSCCIVIVSDC